MLSAGTTQAGNHRKCRYFEEQGRGQEGSPQSTARIQPAGHQLVCVATECLGRSVREHDPRLHHINVVRDAERALDVLIDEQHRLVAGGYVVRVAVPSGRGAAGLVVRRLGGRA